MGYLEQVEHIGLTGEMKFDIRCRCRTEFHLDLIEKVRGRMKKTANWDTDIGLNYTLEASEVDNMLVEKLANKTMRVVTTTVGNGSMFHKLQFALQNDPYVMEKTFETKITPETLNRLSFLERYEGFCIDLIKELAKQVTDMFMLGTSIAFLRSNLSTSFTWCKRVATGPSRMGSGRA